MNKKIIWKSSVVVAVISLLLVIVQIWFAPFPKDFYEKLIGTWTALIITLVLLALIDRIINKD